MARSLLVAVTTAEQFFGSLKDTITFLKVRISFLTLMAVVAGCQSVKKILKTKKLTRKTKIRFKCAKTGKPKKFGATTRASLI